MKKFIIVVILILAVVLSSSCGPSSDKGEESGLKFSQSNWNAVDEYNLDKVSQTPTFTLNKGVEESKNGIIPFTFFTDGMVLQRNSVNRIFGTSDYDGGVAVEIGGKLYYGLAENGSFEIYLPPVSNGNDLTMTIYGNNNKVTIRDVCYGEVILFSGQSNMNWRMSNTISATWPNQTPGKQFLSYYGLGGTPYVPTRESDPQTYYEYTYTKTLADEYVAKAEKEIATDDYIRLMLLDSNYTEEGIAENKTPRSDYDIDKAWQKADNRESVLDCSMFAYYFAKNLRSLTKVPVGVIVAAIGSTNTTTWVDRETYNQNKSAFPDTGESTTSANSISSCYNTFISPMIGYKFGSYVWYQGEGECAGETYSKAFSAMVNAYRSVSDNPNLKVLVISLPQYGSGATYPAGYSQNNYGIADKELGLENSTQTYGRANQQKLSKLIENCAVSVSVNTGDFDDIHPSDKCKISYQAVCCYLTDLYGFKDVFLLYPRVDKVDFIGGDVQIYFKNLGEGLNLRNNGIGFQVSENGTDYQQIKALKVGDSVYLSSASAGIGEIKYVRYGWLQFPRISRIDAEKYVSVFNSFGMPLDQFEIEIN